MPAIAFASLQWKAAPMPGGSAPVQLATLPRAPEGAFRAFVRFPAGWSRRGAGYYAVAEELLILEGDLRLNDVGWREGGYAWIPARRVRSGMRSESGCLAFAWFAGPPRWIPGEPPEPALATDRSLAHWRDAPDGRLHNGPEHVTRISEGELLALSCAHREVLDLRDCTWCLDAAPQLRRGTAGPAFLREW
jgi:hypothetical protein